MKYREQMDDKRISKLQERLDYKFNDTTLLIRSLTHSSFANEKNNSGISSNERLEFLGDSLLGMMVALLIYETEPEMSEGQMTKQRAEFVCEKNLAALSTLLELGSYLFLGRGEDTGGGRKRPSILADAFEAVLAAIYLDGGFSPAYRFVTYYFKNHINNVKKADSDYKTLLQETVQVKSGQKHTYELTNEEGPDHDKTFTAAVKLNDKIIGTGKGKSKKSAEQEAARAALESIGKSKM